MRKITENLIHQGWVDDEFMAARPGKNFPVIKVQIKWLEKSAKAIKILQNIFGKPTRLFRVSAAVYVLFRNGTLISLPCPLQSMDAYLAALREML
jgi:hypothetical protein